MDDVRETTSSLLAEKPDLESDLQDLLDVDEDGPWTFDDIPLDSGTFGEIVSRGIVEKQDDGYRLVDRDAVAAALNGEPVPTKQDEERDTSISLPSLPNIDTQTALILGGALAFVALVRIVFMWNSVFRGGHIVLAGNDPYYYRYWVDTLLASDLQAFDLGSLSQLPADAANSDVLLIVLLWWAASLVGSGQTASGLVVAWYPVIGAIVTGLVIYLVSVDLTSDQRVGVAAVVLLAVTPAHAYRSALGFGDHHASDFTLISLLLLSTIIATDRGQSTPELNWRGMAATIGIGLSAAAQVLAWRGGLLLLLPIGLYVAIQTVSDVAANESPLYTNRHLIAGLGLGSIIVLIVHGTLGWGEVYRAIVPVALVVGILGTVLLGSVWNRTKRTSLELAGVMSVTALGVTIVSWLYVPSFQTITARFMSFLTGQVNTAETVSLFSSGLGTIVGPMIVLGLVFFLSLPYLARISLTAYRQNESKWLFMSVISWYLLFLAVTQIRFAGPLSVLLVIFAAVGFLHVAEHVDITRDLEVFQGRSVNITIPSGHTIRMLFLLFVLVGGIGLLQSAVKMNQISISEENYHTAIWIKEYSSTSGLNYPNNYVLSDWGRNRMFNYFVNGRAESYEFARSEYNKLIASRPSESWVSQNLDRVGFIVVNDDYRSLNEQSVYHRLYNNHGSRSGNIEGLGNYRLIHVSAGGDQKVFQLVPGATITGSTCSGHHINARTEVRNPIQFTYKRRIPTTSSRTFNVTVPYPGEYSIANEVVNISAAEVNSGSEIPIGDVCSDT